MPPKILARISKALHFGAGPEGPPAPPSMIDTSLTPSDTGIGVSISEKPPKPIAEAAQTPATETPPAPTTESAKAPETADTPPFRFAKDVLIQMAAGREALFDPNKIEGHAKHLLGDRPTDEKAAQKYDTDLQAKITELKEQQERNLKFVTEDLPHVDDFGINRKKITATTADGKQIEVDNPDPPNEVQRVVDLISQLGDESKKLVQSINESRRMHLKGLNRNLTLPQYQIHLAEMLTTETPDAIEARAKKDFAERSIIIDETNPSQQPQSEHRAEATPKSPQDLALDAANKMLARTLGLFKLDEKHAQLFDMGQAALRETSELGLRAKYEMLRRLKKELKHVKRGDLSAIQTHELQELPAQIDKTIAQLVEQKADQVNPMQELLQEYYGKDSIPEPLKKMAENNTLSWTELRAKVFETIRTGNTKTVEAILNGTQVARKDQKEIVQHLISRKTALRDLIQMGDESDNIQFTPEAQKQFIKDKLLQMGMTPEQANDERYIQHYMNVFFPPRKNHKGLIAPTAFMIYSLLSGLMQDPTVPETGGGGGQMAAHRA